VSAANAVADWLRLRGLLKGRAGKSDLLRWCHRGQLDGSLSVSLQATPDEAAGPLLHRLGGAARRLKLLDVRVKPGEPMELQVEFSLPERKVEKWSVEDVPGLLHNLNDLYRGEPDVSGGVLLGEFQDMWQLWAVPKPDLRELLERRWFEPRNRSDLESLFKPRDED
jgi:hypothetical protein